MGHLASLPILLDVCDVEKQMMSSVDPESSEVHLYPAKRIDRLSTIAECMFYVNMFIIDESSELELPSCSSPCIGVGAAEILGTSRTRARLRSKFERRGLQYMDVN